MQLALHEALCSPDEAPKEKPDLVLAGLPSSKLIVLAKTSGRRALNPRPPESHCAQESWFRRANSCKITRYHTLISGV